MAVFGKMSALELALVGMKLFWAYRKKILISFTVISDISPHFVQFYVDFKLEALKC